MSGPIGDARRLVRRSVAMAGRCARRAPRDLQHPLAALDQQPLE
jgi:hypothetical protein